MKIWKYMIYRKFNWGNTLKFL